MAAALLEAVIAGSLSRVRVLLEAARLDGTLKRTLAAFDGQTPLVTAASHGQLAIVKLLIATGVDVDACERGAGTPLILAAYHGHIVVVKSLIAAGANVDATAYSKATALMAAAWGGHLDVCKALIAAGANLNWRGSLRCFCVDRREGTALEFANDPAVKAFLSSVSAGAVASSSTGAADTRVNAALLAAAASGDLAAARAALKAKADVNVIDVADGRVTPLTLASRGGHVPLIRLFIAMGALLEAVDHRGRSTVLHAALGGHTECAKLLVALGVDVNARNRDGSTALMKAADVGDARAIHVLVAAGSHINDVDFSGNSALSVAAARGHLDAVRALLGRGADIMLRNNIDRTPLSASIEYAEVFDVLSDAALMDARQLAEAHGHVGLDVREAEAVSAGAGTMNYPEAIL